MTTDPFFHTWTEQRSARGREVTGGAGAWFETPEGRWLDLGSGSFHAALGYGHPRMIAAIERQARGLCVSSAWTSFPAKRELAARLLELAPPSFRRGKVFFTLGGAEANENAMKMARLVTGKPKFVARYRSYHGASLGALSLTGDYRRPPLEPLLPGIVRLTNDRADELGEILANEGGTVSAVFLEPIPGANGVHVPPSGFFAGVREACSRHGALLVADEVLTGLGRTGRGFAMEHEGVEPDLITLAKAVTAGYAPLGAVLVSEKLARYFEDHVLWAGLTNYGHPLGCAAGVEALAIYAEERLFERVARLEASLLGPLRALADRCPAVENPRGRGLLAGIDLRLAPAAWKRLTADLEARRIHLFAAQKRGTVVLAPPYIIGEEELASGLAAVAEAIENAHRGDD
jgi:taurine--2-oxoglutarate transaminase